MKHISRSILLLSMLLVAASASAEGGMGTPTLNLNVLGTRSIVACDAATQSCGVAVISFPVTSSTVPHGRPRVAVASQMLPSTDEAQAIMDRVESGETPQAALTAVLAADPGAAMRQVGVVSLDSHGTVRVGQFTGDASWTQRCAVAGATYAVQAAGQTNAAICQAMAEGFTRASGSLAMRLMAALKAGIGVGRDTRGERSATLRVWSAVSPLSAVTPLLADASVSGKANALAALEEELYRYLGQVAPADPADQVTLDDSTIRSLKHELRDLDYYHGSMDGRWNDNLEDALTAFQASNVLFPRASIPEYRGVRKIDGPLLQFILRAAPGTLVPAP
ncbi:DUF1028 domain-containing protein [Hyalangium versicolor]|uniref:DUF1028 domain-containing protein n=1 Tax=Hyalangium versicolor TaxID=2861190 RepID=UPI001CCC1468|nr:DUF1028 domain-containing protein [Hyalangium versicolor]